MKLNLEWILSFSRFERVLAPCMDVMKERMKKYEGFKAWGVTKGKYIFENLDLILICLIFVRNSVTIIHDGNYGNSADVKWK